MNKFSGLAVALTAALFLAACGGGSSNGSTDGLSSKSVSGIVAGSADAPTFGGDIIEISGSITNNGDAGTSRDVQPGDSIVASVVSMSAKAVGTVVLKDVEVIHEVQGNISAIDVASGSFVVLGQLVLVDALTELVTENFDDTLSSIALAELLLGDYVEVSGSRDDNGNILATRVERKVQEADDPDELKLRGRVSSLDDQARTFLLENLQIDYSQAEVEGTLTEGARVKVEGTLQGDVLLATEVEVGDERYGRVEDDAEIEVQGVIGALDTTAMTFVVQGYRVDYSAARVEGVLANNGARVEVEGRVSGTTPPRIIASEVEVKHERPAARDTSDDEVKGPISAIDTAALTFRVGAQAFYADDNTVFEQDDRGGSLGDLVEGDFVEVKFDSTQTNPSGAAYAIKVENETERGRDDDADDDDRDNDSGQNGVELEGRVEAFDGAAFTLVINGVTVVTTESTRFEIDDQPATAEDVFAVDRTGWEAEARGHFQDGVLSAERIEFEMPEGDSSESDDDDDESR